MTESISDFGAGPMAAAVTVPEGTSVLPASLIISQDKPGIFLAFLTSCFNSASESTFKQTLGCPVDSQASIAQVWLALKAAKQAWQACAAALPLD